MGEFPGTASAANYGTHNMATYNPRQMQFRATFRF